MSEHNALGYWSGLALCLTKVRSSRACCPATALINMGRCTLGLQILSVPFAITILQILLFFVCFDVFISLSYSLCEIYQLYFFLSKLFIIMVLGVVSIVYYCFFGVSDKVPQKPGAEVIKLFSCSAQLKPAHKTC